METSTRTAPAIEPDAIVNAVEFLGALFDPNDEVLFRPIETWVESVKSTAVLTTATPAIAGRRRRFCRPRCRSFSCLRTRSG